MKNLTLTTSIFLILLFSGCNQSIKKGSEFLSGDTIAINISHGDSLFLPNYACISMAQPYMFHVNGKDFYMAYNPKTHSLDIFNITDRIADSQIMLQKEGPDGIVMPDGIAYYQEHFIIVSPKGIHKVTKDGKIISTIQRPDTDTFMVKDYSPMKFPNFCQYNTLNFFPEEKMLATCLYPKGLNEEKINDPYIIILYQIETGETETIEIPYPAEFSKYENWGILNNPGICLNGNILLFNFGGLSDIYVYNRISKEMQKHSIPSAHLKPFIVPEDKNDENAFLNAGYYFPLKYDPFRNVYWRLQGGPTNFVFDFNRSLSLTKISADFIHYEEIQLPAGLELFPVPLIGKKDIVLSFIEPEEDEEFWLFRVNPDF